MLTKFAVHVATPCNALDDAIATAAAVPMHSCDAVVTAVLAVLVLQCQFVLHGKHIAAHTAREDLQR